MKDSFRWFSDRKYYAAGRFTPNSSYFQARSSAKCRTSEDILVPEQMVQPNQWIEDYVITFVSTFIKNHHSAPREGIDYICSGLTSFFVLILLSGDLHNFCLLLYTAKYFWKMFLGLSSGCVPEWWPARQTKHEQTLRVMEMKMLSWGCDESWSHHEEAYGRGSN